MILFVRRLSRSPSTTEDPLVGPGYEVSSRVLRYMEVFAGRVMDVMMKVLSCPSDVMLQLSHARLECLCADATSTVEVSLVSETL